jgi:hypothetical protein
LRPLHTSAVIFAFGGNALIATSFYVVQRTTAARLWGGNLAWFVFWGYNLFIVLAASGYVLGGTQSKEYAEPTWYVDIWLTIVWVAYLAVFLGTIVKRKEPHIYVANWFYLAFIVTIAMLTYTLTSSQGQRPENGHQSSTFDDIHGALSSTGIWQIACATGLQDAFVSGVQIDAKASSLNSGDCFVLVTPSTVRVWEGSSSNAAERATAKVIASVLAPGYSLVEEEEGSASDAFWKALGGKGEYAKVKVPMDGEAPPRLFECSNRTGALEPEELFGWSQQDLLTSECYLLDSLNTLFVWVGKEANATEREGALELAKVRLLPCCCPAAAALLPFLPAALYACPAAAALVLPLHCTCCHCHQPSSLCGASPLRCAAPVPAGPALGPVPLPKAANHHRRP